MLLFLIANKTTYSIRDLFSRFKKEYGHSLPPSDKSYSLEFFQDFRLEKHLAVSQK